MAEQRQFRFRLPWLSAATAPPAPVPGPEAPPPPTTTEIRAPTRPTTTISIQRPPFRPVGIAPPPETPAVQLPATQRPSSPPPTTKPQPKSPVRTERPGTAPPSPTRPSSPPPPQTTVPQQKSPVRLQPPGTAPPSPTRPAGTESGVASLPANQMEPKITPPPPPVPDFLTKSQSFVPVEELKLSEPRSKDDIAPPKIEYRTQTQQKLSSVSEKPKSEATNGAPTRFSPFSRDPEGEIKREEEIGTEGKTMASVSEENNLRNRVAALLSSVASKQANESAEKEEISEIRNPSKGIGSSDQKFMGSSSSSHSRRKASSEFRDKAAATSSNGGEQVPMHREVKEDVFKLIQKLNQGQIGEVPASIITLSGKNRGATMDFGGEQERKDISLRNQDESTNEEHRPTMAYINSNTQSINNSILLESVVNGRDPGVHLSLSHYNQPDFENPTADNEDWAERAEFSLSTANKLTHEPQVRTRCLRGLFLEETSDSDPDNPQRHGCKERDIEIL